MRISDWSSDVCSSDLLIPKDPEDAKNAIIEIRGGTGGDEAALFAGGLYRMYTRYFEDKGWKVETMDVTEGPAGGYKEVILKVTGEDVYGKLKYESGVHRVQRVLATETQGRVHTTQEDRRIGNECFSTFRPRRSPYDATKNTSILQQ